ncbi:MAG: hypothetical protein Q8J85_07085 [Sulfuricurvum sp.]|nr:hypothetical protein [Sulfuricurvum sp.]MDP3023010.1 hypothetical protein [Sulfuricurvum sp.]
MKKTIISIVGLVSMVSMVSANEIITDKSGNEHNVGLVLGVDKLVSNGESAKIFNLGINDTVKTNCGLKLTADATLGYSNKLDNSITGVAFLTVGAGLVSPNYIVWNNSIEGVVGLQVRHELGHEIYLVPKLGVLINKRLEVAFTQYKNGENINAVGVSYKF